MVVEKLNSSIPKYDYLIVNDGSSDKTGKICFENDYNSIHLPVNLGLAGAFQTGIKYAIKKNYDACLQFDADGQHQPEYIEALVKQMQKTNCDIVIGSRDKKAIKGIRKAGNSMLKYLIKKVTGVSLSDPTSGLRLYNHKTMIEMADAVNLAPEPDTLVHFINKGYYIQEVKVKMNERLCGKSYLGGIRSCEYMLQMMISIIFLHTIRR